MATFLKSPLSPSSVYHTTFFLVTPKDPTAQFSGATTLPCPQEHQVPACPPTTLPNMPHRIEYRERSLSGATTSTTKSQLRYTNRNLAEMLEKVQKELTTHQSIMLDIQSRIRPIERFCRFQSSSMPDRSSRKSANRRRMKRKSSPSHESRAWWEACQNYAQNCDTPFDAQDFLRTPLPFDGLDFEFHDEQLKRASSSIIPAIDDVPPLTPTSHSDGRDDKSDIVERIVEFDRVRIRRPPLLHTPPRSRSKASTVGSADENMTALPMFVRTLTPGRKMEHSSRGGRIRRIMSKINLLHKHV